MRFFQSDRKPLIYTRMFGGMGNQLFQYSAGRSLADKLGCDLAIDTRYLKKLNRANCMPHFANARYLENSSLPPFKRDNLLKYASWRLLPSKPNFHRESAPGFNPDLLRQPAGTYLHGYWQSERYFKDISDKLRNDLTFTTSLTGANADMASMIGSSANPVGVHFRRSDYLGIDAFASCPGDYYASALDHVAVNSRPLPPPHMLRVFR